MASPSPFIGRLSQRVGVTTLVGKTSGESAACSETQGRGIGALVGCEITLRLTSSDQQSHHAMVTLVASRLGIDPILAVLLFLHVVPDGPRFRPDRRILHRYHIPDPFPTDPLPPRHQ